MLVMYYLTQIASGIRGDVLCKSVLFTVLYDITCFNVCISLFKIKHCMMTTEEHCIMFICQIYWWVAVFEFSRNHLSMSRKTYFSFHSCYPPMFQQMLMMMSPHRKRKTRCKRWHVDFEDCRKPHNHLEPQLHNPCKNPLGISEPKTEEDVFNRNG